MPQWDWHRGTLTYTLAMVKWSVDLSITLGVESMHLHLCMNLHVIMSGKHEVNLQSTNHGTSLHA